MLAWVLNTPLPFEDSSNVLFFKRIFHYKVPEILTSLIKHAEHLIFKKDFISM